MKSKLIKLISTIITNKYWILGAILVPGSSIFILYKILDRINTKKREALKKAMEVSEGESE